MRLTKAQLFVLEALLVKHYYDNEWEPLENLWPAKSATVKSLTRHGLLDRKSRIAHVVIYENDTRSEYREVTYAYRLTKAGRDLLGQRAKQR